MSSNFVMPKQIISGAGALNDAKDVFKKAGKKALIVSGKVMEKVGNVAKVTKILDELSIEYAIYTDITGEPTDVMIEEVICHQCVPHAVLLSGYPRFCQGMH